MTQDDTRILAQHKSNAQGRQRQRRRRQRGRRRHFGFLVTCSLGVLIGLILATLLGVSSAQDEEEEGDFGEPIEDLIEAFTYKELTYSSYTSNPQYIPEENYSTVLVDYIYNFTHVLFDGIAIDKSPIPPGYISVMNEDSIVFGHKVEENDWAALLWRYWLPFIWVVILLLLIIIMPFIAVIYCCFCCCRHCSEGCAPCDKKGDLKKRCLCGFLLFLLLLGLLFGLIVAFAASFLMERGFEYTNDTMHRGTNDTCTFLRDISDHLQHLFVYNYEELELHLRHNIDFAHDYIYEALLQNSEAGGVYEMKRIFENMPRAEKLMKKVVKLQKELQFFTAQLRDGVRCVKRDVNYACSALCGNRDCLNFLKTSQIEVIDASPCLHLDLLPDASVYLKAMSEITSGGAEEVPDKIVDRFQIIDEYIRIAVTPLGPPLIQDVIEGKQVFHDEATKIHNKIDSMISSINLNTLHSTKSLEDLEEKFGSSRSLINMAICVFLTLILVILVLALLWGCFGPSRHSVDAGFFSKITGSWLLLLAILLIFCIFSLLVLLSLFYFVMGLVAYHGVCAPMRDLGKNEFFRQLDATIDVKRLVMPAETNPENLLMPLRMSKTLSACQSGQSVFDLLKDNNLFDIDELVRIEIIRYHDVPNITVFPANFTEFEIYTEDELTELDEISTGNLSDYVSSVFTDHLCQSLTPVDLPTMATRLRSLKKHLPNHYGRYNLAKVALENAASNVEKYDKFAAPIHTIINKMVSYLNAIDRLILSTRMDFGQSIKDTMNALIYAQQFLRDNSEIYVSALRSNLSVYVEEQIADYEEMVINNCHQKVGICAPLVYIYHHGVDRICERLVDPLNGFWVGLIICALFLLPILFVAHYLMCLYSKIYPLPLGTMDVSCPVCARNVMLPFRATFISSAASYCVCNEMVNTRIQGGDPTPPAPALATASAPAPQLAPPTTTVAVVEPPIPELDSSVVSSKHKQE